MCVYMSTSAKGRNSDARTYASCPMPHSRRKRIQDIACVGPCISGAAVLTVAQSSAHRICWIGCVDHNGTLPDAQHHLTPKMLLTCTRATVPIIGRSLSYTRSAANNIADLFNQAFYAVPTLNQPHPKEETLSSQSKSRHPEESHLQIRQAPLSPYIVLSAICGFLIENN